MLLPPTATTSRSAPVAGAEDTSRVERAAELAEREAAHFLSKGNHEAAASVRRTAAALAGQAPPVAPAAAPALTDTRGLAASVDQTALQAELTAEEEAMLAELEGADADVDVGVSRAAKRPREEADSAVEGSAAEPSTSEEPAAGRVSEWSDGDDDDDSDSDDEEALLAELAEVRREREAEAARQREAEEAAAAAELEAAAASGNPLLRLAGEGGGAIKRRWDEDVVFRNQASAAPAPGRRFVNDTLRNDFHLRFMRKYIQ